MAPRLIADGRVGAPLMCPRGVDVAAWRAFVAGDYRVAGRERRAAERLVEILQAATDAGVHALKWNGRWAAAEACPALDTAALVESVMMTDAVVRSTPGATWTDLLGLLVRSIFTVTSQLRALDWVEHAIDFERDVVDVLVR